MKSPLPGQDLGEGTQSFTAISSKVKSLLSHHRGLVSNTYGKTLTSCLFSPITLP